MRRPCKRHLLPLLSLLVLSACGADGSAPPQRACPGDCLVGNASFVLEDPSRELSCGPGNRRLVTEIWYPARDDARRWPVNHVSDFLLDQADAVAALFGEDQVNDVTTGSFRDAPLHPTVPPMPILLFSHGFSSNRFQNYTMAVYLARHGYLVVAPDHTCNALVAPLPEGPLFFDPANIPLTIDERVADIRFLVDVFVRDPPDILRGRLDPERIGVWGHSFGGFTATEVAKVEPRVSALVQLAAFGRPSVPPGLDLPSLYMWGKEDKWMWWFRDFHHELIERMPAPKYVLNFPDTAHFAFSDLCSFSVQMAENGDGCGWGTRIDTDEPFLNPAPARMHEVMNPYTRAFFGAALLGNPEDEAYVRENHFPGWIEHEAILD